jgi:hypothetical protein
MTLKNVQDDIILGYIHINDPVLQQVTIDDVASVSVIKENLDQEEEDDDNTSSVPDTQLAFVKQVDAVEVENSFTLIDIAVSVANNFDASARAIPDTTQNIAKLSDDEFDEVVQAYLHVIKQVSKSQKKN